LVTSIKHPFDSFLACVRFNSFLWQPCQSNKTVTVLYVSFKRHPLQHINQRFSLPSSHQIYYLFIILNPPHPQYYHCNCLLHSLGQFGNTNLYGELPSCGSGYGCDSASWEQDREGLLVAKRTRGYELESWSLCCACRVLAHAYGREWHADEAA